MSRKVQSRKAEVQKSYKKCLLLSLNTYRQCFRKTMLQLKVTNNLIATEKQIFRKLMPLLCNVSENETNLNDNELGHKRKGKKGRGSNTIADYCVLGSLQIRPSESLNVCKQMNVTERITIASIFHLLSRNSRMLVKQTSDRKGFINTTNYNNNIYLDKLFALNSTIC